MTPPEPTTLAVAIGGLSTAVTALAAALRYATRKRRSIASDYYRQAQSTLAKKATDYDTRLEDIEKKLDRTLVKLEELKSQPWKMATVSKN